MILAAAFLAAAVLFGFAAPRWLRSLACHRVGPRLVLSAWVLSQVFFVGLLIAAPIAWVTRPGLHWQYLPTAALTCARAVREQGMVSWLPPAEILLWGTIAVVLVRTLLVVTVSCRRHRRSSAGHLGLVRALGRSRHSAVTGETVWLADATLFAYSIGGRSGVVVAGDGLASLNQAERSAVLAHERAHLRGRHHLLVTTAEALRAALPFVPLCREWARWARVLVELSADHHAVRACGSDAVRGALLACGPASHLTDRIHLLDDDFRHGRWYYDASIALTVSVLPVAVTVASVTAGWALYCALVTP